MTKGGFWKQKSLFSFIICIFIADNHILMSKTTSYYILLIAFSALLLTSCGTQRTSNATLYNPVEVADLSDKLGVKLSNIDKDDDKNMGLYAEVSLWLGVPYRYGGLSRKGLDCSSYISESIWSESSPFHSRPVNYEDEANIERQPEDR